MAAQGSILGNAVLRLEDPNLLKGAEHYTDDMPVEGVGYIHFVRSPYAHATIDSVDTSEAAGMAGVTAVYTVDNMEIADFQGFPMFDPVFNRPVLARGKVRYVGDIVAAVVADSREAAVDAAEAVTIDYTPLPVVTDIAEATSDSAPVLFDDHGSNLVFESVHPPEGGGDDPLAGADHVAHCRMVSQRLAGVPMEPNGCIAIPDGDSLEVWISSQNPIAVRDAFVGQLRSRSREAPGCRSRRRWRIRPKGRSLHRAFHHDQSCADAWPPREVGGRAQREHGVDGARAGDGARRQARPHQRREDRRDRL